MTRLLSIFLALFILGLTTNCAKKPNVNIDLKKDDVIDHGNNDDQDDDDDDDTDGDDDVITGSVSLSPSEVGLGQVVIGNQASAEMELTNGTSASISGIALNGITASSSPFKIISNSCPTTLSSNQKCTFRVAFNPVSAVDSSVTFKINYILADEAKSIDGIRVSGTGTQISNNVEATLNPMIVRFQEVRVGQTHTAAMTLNSGSKPISSITFNGISASSSPFRIASNQCTGGSLAANSSCTFQLVYAPQSVGSSEISFNIHYQREGSAKVISNVMVSGVAVSGPVTGVASLNTMIVNFRPVIVGQSASYTFTLTNNASAAIDSIGFEGISTTSSSFRLGANLCNTTIAAGASCSFTVAFLPTVVMSYESHFTVKYRLAGVQKSIENVTLSGTGISGSISDSVTLNPMSANFRPLIVGQSASVAFTLTNNGMTVIDSIAFEGISSSSSPFKIASSLCNTAMLPGTSCSFTVAFAPTAVTSYSSLFKVKYRINGVQKSIENVSLTGSGISAPVTDSVTLNPMSYNFGLIAVGSRSTHGFRLMNSGTSSIQSITFEGISATSSPFKIEGNTCSGTITSNGYCDFNVVYAPVGSGSQGLVFKLKYVLNGVQKSIDGISLSGSAASVDAGAVTISPSNYQFGDVPKGSSRNYTFILSNGTPRAITSIVPEGISTTSAPFKLLSNQCTTTLPSNGRCTFTVAYAPTATGNHSLIFKFISSGGSSNSVSVFGNGVIQLVWDKGVYRLKKELAPGAVDFRYSNNRSESGGYVLPVPEDREVRALSVAEPSIGCNADLLVYSVQFDSIPGLTFHTIKNTVPVNTSVITYARVAHLGYICKTSLNGSLRELRLYRKSIPYNGSNYNKFRLLLVPSGPSVPSAEEQELIDLGFEPVSTLGYVQ